MDCACDYDVPEFYRTSTPTARKGHKCYECGTPICPGERYKCTVAKWEGSVYTFKTCGNCSDLEQWVRNNVPCICWAHGNMLDDLRESIDDAVERARSETIGLTFGFLRRLYHIRKTSKERRTVR